MDYEFTRARLQQLFDQSNLTQKEFADLCGLTQSTVTRLLSGKRSPQLVTLVKICHSFKLKPSWFVKELVEDGLADAPTITEPSMPVGPTARSILQELAVLEEDSLKDVLEFIRFRKRQGRRRRA